MIVTKILFKFVYILIFVDIAIVVVLYFMLRNQNEKRDLTGRYEAVFEMGLWSGFWKSHRHPRRRFHYASPIARNIPKD